MEFLVKSMDNTHPGYPMLVVSNDWNAKGLRVAKQLNISTKYFPNISFERDFLNYVGDDQPDLICLAGFMKILSPDFVSRYQNKILNIHPSLLPNYKGLNTHKRVILSKERITGCTVHVVTENIDDGLILGQSKVLVETNDTALTLAKKVIKKEHILYPKALRRYLDGKTTFFSV